MRYLSPEYRSWHFRDRSFILALSLSLLWHVFWFFAVTIVVSPPPVKEKTRPKLNFLGPVLGDDIFKTLVQTKPVISEAFYRNAADLSPAIEIETKVVTRHATGDVVSVPLGTRFTRPLKEFVGGEKLSPDFDFHPAKDYSLGEYTESGDIS